MDSLWNDADAADAVARYSGDHGEDVALRVYTSRLIGSEPRLVLHGGGNTSVKTTATTALGEVVEVICVKGSGWDLATIEPAGLPMMRRGPLQQLGALQVLTDDEMMNQARTQMLDASAPNPSVEVLLHAFLPEKFVDHTHADPVLELTNQPDGERAVEQALGGDVVVLPWVMPGFLLAKAVAHAHQQNPGCEGIVICKHGLFTFADDARSSYEKMIELGDRADRYVAERCSGDTMISVPAALDDGMEAMTAAALPGLRGALSRVEVGALGERFVRPVVERRATPELVAFSRHPDAAEMVRRGPLTPDHVIRTSREYLYLDAEAVGDADACREAVAAYRADYESYFRAHAPEDGSLEMRAAEPRVVVVEGAGLLAFGEDKRAAVIAADIAEHTLRSIARARAVGDYDPLGPEGVFDIEYWPLELAKLSAPDQAPLAGQVGLVTGAAGAIGHGIADALLGAGCHVVITDVDQARLEVVQAELAERHRAERVVAATADVTSDADVARLFEVARLSFGGVDVVVPNAGIAYVSKLADMEPDRLRKVLDVNVTGTMTVLKHAAAVFAEQRTGGAVVVQSSKNVFDPGAGFGAYSASKAGAHQLGKIAALELAPLGVTVNMVNADAVFGDAQIPSGLWELVGPDRMKSRGLDPEGLREYYRERSLLKRSVLPAHVGQAVVFFASGVTPTTGATLPVDAGVPGAFPR